jgi:hypothetical protein
VHHDFSCSLSHAAPKQILCTCGCGLQHQRLQHIAEALAVFLAAVHTQPAHLAALRIDHCTNSIKLSVATFHSASTFAARRKSTKHSLLTASLPLQDPNSLATLFLPVDSSWASVTQQLCLSVQKLQETLAAAPNIAIQYVSCNTLNGSRH